MIIVNLPKPCSRKLFEATIQRMSALNAQRDAPFCYCSIVPINFICLTMMQVPLGPMPG